MKNRFALTVSLSALLALTGCAVQPVALTPVQKELIASTWSEGEGTVEAAQLRQAPEQWWAAWNDPSLSTLVAATLKNNTDIAQAQANLRAARASLLSATSQLFPSATLGADGSRSRRNDVSTDSYSADAAAENPHWGMEPASAPTTGPNCAARESSSGVLVSRFSM